MKKKIPFSNVSLGGCTITPKTKINKHFLKKFSSLLRCPFRVTPFEKISKNVDFSLLCVIFMILVSNFLSILCFCTFENVNIYVDFSLWGNRATTQNTFFDIFKSTKTEKSETKIMKITHSSGMVWWLIFEFGSHR